MQTARKHTHPDIVGLLGNPIWHTLHTRHKQFAISNGAACRYPADMAPFAATATPETASMKALRTLLKPGEKVWVRNNNNSHLPDLPVDQALDVYQMIASTPVELPPPAHAIIPLTLDDADDMLELTDIAFPEFFRARTAAMGRYFGMRSETGQLIAMCGERMMCGNATELSGICTHPDFRGHGLAAALITYLLKLHQSEGVISWLHVTNSNDNAVRLYLRTGFEIFSEATYTRLVYNA